MGAFSSTLSRRNGGVEVVDITSHNAYRYPPKSGTVFNYFPPFYSVSVSDTYFLRLDQLDQLLFR